MKNNPVMAVITSGYDATMNKDHKNSTKGIK